MGIEIALGCQVTLHLSLSLEDTKVEDTFGGSPLRWVIGDGTLAPQLERHLYGLREGEKRSFSLAPEEGFGYPDPEAISQLPREDFPQGIAAGMLWSFTLPDGESIPGRIVEVGEVVTVDFNHPLAGHRLLMEVEVLKVEPP